MEHRNETLHQMFVPFQKQVPRGTLLEILESSAIQPTTRELTLGAGSMQQTVPGSRKLELLTNQRITVEPELICRTLNVFFLF